MRCSSSGKESSSGISIVLTACLGLTSKRVSTLKSAVICFVCITVRRAKQVDLTDNQFVEIRLFEELSAPGLFKRRRAGGPAAATTGRGQPRTIVATEYRDKSVEKGVCS